MLPHVIDAIGHAVPLIVDGGIRRGTDVLKVLQHVQSFYQTYRHEKFAKF